MVTVISRFRVRNGLEKQVRHAFLNRPHLVEKAPGFCGLSVATDASDPAIFLLLTRWTDTESFRAWHASDAHHQSHQLIPEGLKLDPAFTSLTIGNTIDDPAGPQSLDHALENQTAAISLWLIESDAVFVLLVAPDGTIRARNRAARHVFPLDPANNFGSTIWDYLVGSDVRHLREWFSTSAEPYGGCVLLNLADGQQNPITVEVGLVRCGQAILLLGTHERRHDSNLQTEILKLTNDLSLMVRDSVQKNRQLQEANQTIQRLARTDALTGLATRRTLDEAFLREIARAQRHPQGLSLIMADLDRFKSINDEYGHVIGDQVLIAAATVFKTQVRPFDLAARYGGEEFVLLLPGTSTADAVGIAERLRSRVAAMLVPACPRPITISLGVATWRTGETPDQLVARADAALYDAKRAGRDCLRAAPSTHEE
ncbi:MAG: diguanylate cyclase [Candidatus Korobacteraceae bacterium]